MLMMAIGAVAMLLGFLGFVLCLGLERSKNMHYFLWGTGVYRKFLQSP